MTCYLLDTHIFIWLLTDDDRLDKNIREDIEYFQYPYYVSIETLREIVILQSLNKITFDGGVEKIVNYLEKAQIQIMPIEINHIKTLENLPIAKVDKRIHDDPFDRLLIAQAIAEKFTIVSSDGKFLSYRDYGLKLLVN
ncbi:MAG: type II toxin-antitoxin system VapC family toxin [Prevotella sp.]|jgi:PIN domain nuclease of toxin-antitoxin system|nr:type II toxin-antitoxin system VapC family toxin [Prevotella sp.]